MLSARRAFAEGWSCQDRNPFQQHVAGSKQTDENSVDNALLSDDDFADFGTYFIEFRDRRVMAASVAIS